MFVICYVVAMLAVSLGAVGIGLVSEWTSWQIAGAVLGLLLIAQLFVLAYVVLRAFVIPVRANRTDIPSPDRPDPPPPCPERFGHRS